MALALLPLPAFLWFLWTFIAGVRGADELERRIQLEALAVAFPLTLVLIMTLGLLQIAVPLSPDDWSYRHIWPFLYVFYLLGLTLGAAALRMRNRMKVLRAERDLSQAALADALEVSRQTINAIETGKYDPSLPLALKMARLFGQPVEAIFFLDDTDVSTPQKAMA